MSYVTWKVERYAFIGDGNWSGTPETLPDVYDVDVQMTLGEGKDSFKFKLTNFNGLYDNYFQAQDKIVISRVSNSTTVSGTDVIMTGAVKNIPLESNSKSNIVRVEGYNFSEVIMSAATFTEVNNLTPPQAIKQAINSAKAIAGLDLVWDDTTPNPSLKKDGVTAFPTFSKRYMNETLLKVIQECSSDSLTQDGSYYWWVTFDNKLRWVPNTSGSTYFFNTVVDEHVSIKTGVDTSKIRNYFILKGGRDPAGKTIQFKKINYDSANTHGNKYYFGTAKTATAESLYSLDFPEGTTSVIPSSFPFTTRWLKQSTNAAVTVNSAQEYVEAIRAEVKYRLEKEAELMSDNLGFGKLKADITFAAGVKSWTLGDKITCTIPQLFNTPKILRVVEIQYGTSNDVYSLEEDVGSI